MPMTSEITISSTGHDSPAEQAIARLLALTNAEMAYLVLRTVGESRECDAYSRFLRHETDGPEEEMILVGTDLPTDVVASLYREGTLLLVDVGSCGLSRLIKTAMRTHLDADLLGDFSVNSVHLRIGNHDVFDVGYEDDVRFIGRYFISITFFGEGIPDDPESLLSQTRALDEFHDLEQRFETTFGSAEVAIVIDP